MPTLTLRTEHTCEVRHRFTVTHIALAAEANLALTRGSTGSDTWIAWDVTEGSVLWTASVTEFTDVYAVVQGRFLLARAFDQTLGLAVIELASGREVRRVCTGSAHTSEHYLHTDREHLLVEAWRDGSIGFESWSLLDGVRVATFSEPGGMRRLRAARPRHDQLIAVGDDGRLTLRDLRSLEVVGECAKTSKHAPDSIHVDPRGERALTRTKRGKTWLWNLATGALEAVGKPNSFDGPFVLLPGGAHVALPGGDAIGIFDLARGEQTAVIRAGDHLDRLGGFAVTPDGGHVLVWPHASPRIDIWSLDPVTCVGSVTLPDPAATPAAAAVDGTMACVGATAADGGRVWFGEWHT